MRLHAASAAGIAVVFVMLAGLLTSISFSGGQAEIKGDFPKTDVCEMLEGQRLSYEDFLSLLTSMKSNNCNELKTAKLQFSASFSDIEAMASQSGIKGVLYVDTLRPLGAGVLIIKGDAGNYPLRNGDEIKVRLEGLPEKDILVQVTVKGCDPYDEVCDASCSFVKGVCDPKCYIDGRVTGELCDMDCVDANKDNIIAANDSDGICDLDCYNNAADMERAYDIDCINRYGDMNDNICDPDTNGNGDGKCDLDCEPANSICDPDCDNDPDCKCDNMCNGFCSAGCRNEPDYPDNDPDCQIKEGKISWCEGDGKCDRLGGENCANSDDCPGGGLDSGCTLTKGLDEGSPCSCTNQCDKGQKLVCNNGAKGEGKFCCPDGMAWNGTKCIELEQLNFAYVAIGFSESQKDLFLDSAKKTYEYMWKERYPTKECSDPLARVRPYYIGPEICGSGGCSKLCGDCISAGRACIQKAGLAGKIDKFAVITAGAGFGGCAANIPNDGSSTGYLPPEGTGWKPSGNVFTHNIVAHETGHAFGLYHVEGCGAQGTCMGPNAADCRLPEHHEFVMDYCNPFNRFGPAGYKYMKEKSIAKWLKGCS
ncbi:MAG: hypothetical protein HYX24_00515 [Candidatus Aenigmarchaeota archaeon]|nr:hypothetical protein [Candidatus Aenigmarchaeota archaeon]